MLYLTKIPERFSLKKDLTYEPLFFESFGLSLTTVNIIFLD